MLYAVRTGWVGNAHETVLVESSSQAGAMNIASLALIDSCEDSKKYAAEWWKEELDRKIATYRSREGFVATPLKLPFICEMEEL